jgi:hypothetical protein
VLVCTVTLMLAGSFMSFRKIFTNTESLFVLIALFVIYLAVCYYLKNLVSNRDIDSEIEEIKATTLQN